MARYRRTPFHALRFAEDRRLDLGRMLRGELAGETRVVVMARSALSGEEQPLAERELELLRRLPEADAADAASLDAGEEELRALALRGLAVSDEDDPRLAELRRREAALREGPWSRSAALFHAARRGGDAASDLEVVDYAEVAARGGEAYAAFVTEHGPPPPAFAAVTESGPAIELAAEEPAGGLFDVLRARRSRRAFDRERPLSAADLARLLRVVFAPYGIARLTPEVELLHKTSPSGGSLHPIDAYPLVRDVATVPPGLYHYDGRRHRLVPVAALDRAAARELAVAAACGQTFVGDAHVAVFLVARYRRNFWKYRSSPRTYSVVGMDAGHLGQSFQLAATALGLATVFTAAIDEPRVESALGLETFAAGPLAICACGPPAPSGPDHGLDFAPFSPFAADRSSGER